MKDVIYLLFHLLSTLARLARPESHWVMVVMDQYTRRIIGFAVHTGNVDGPALCRMFNDATSGQGWPQYSGQRLTWRTSSVIIRLTITRSDAILAGMALLQMSQAEKISLLSTTTDGRSIVEVYFSCQWQPKLRTRQGQVGAFDIHPIQEQHMEMDIEIQRSAESLAGFILIDGARFFSRFPRRV